MRLIADAVINEVIEHRNTDSNRRRDVIDQILRINASASTDFLERFADRALNTYLEHLTCTQQPRGRNAVWVRPGDTAAANTVVPA